MVLFIDKQAEKVIPHGSANQVNLCKFRQHF